MVNDIYAFYEQLRGVRLPYTLPFIPFDRCKNLIVDLIIDESTVPKGMYRIYRGESQFIAINGDAVMLTKEEQPLSSEITRRSDIGLGRLKNICYSFSDGLFAGIARDFESGSALGKAILYNNIICVDLPLTGLFDENGPVFIPPISLIGVVLGEGEFHHPRMRKIDALTDITAFQAIEISKDKFPMFFTDVSPIESFWNMLKKTRERTDPLHVTNYVLPTSPF